jgi:hypothetical protein
MPTFISSTYTAGSSSYIDQYNSEPGGDDRGDDDIIVVDMWYVKEEKRGRTWYCLDRRRVSE